MPVLVERPDVERSDLERRIVGNIVRGLLLLSRGHPKNIAALVIALVLVLMVILNRIA